MKLKKKNGKKVSGKLSKKELEGVQGGVVRRKKATKKKATKKRTKRVL